ncbi:hypothetical protein [Natrinema longum]|uniref:Uncharacterized protein n=1 Tax=Natrinema longum TaxID=370324 RepID=A0A8A2UCD7_9EURY|nr:hypothetical protein [Natrinema longum]MBZ6495785.1 hypothetical protein [Natrinema longum]QSW86270.1 hypothetical protein J0X27_05485 [Natrinema longum]
MSTSISRWPRAGAVRARWAALERDWKSVVVGATIVTLHSVFGVPIPW